MAQFLGEGASWTEWHFALHGDGTDLSGARETWPKGEVGGGEVAGRWSEETASFLRQLARARARSEPPVLQRRAEQAWRLRWGCWHVQQHVLSLVHSWRRGCPEVLTATPPASTRSWESVVSLVWRQPEWVARCTVVIDVQQFPFSISRGKRKEKEK